MAQVLNPMAPLACLRPYCSKKRECSARTPACYEPMRIAGHHSDTPVEVFA